MNGLIQLLPAIGFALAVFLLALLCFCLRGYSRHRLEKVCESRQRPARFGQIVQSGEQVLLVLEVSMLIVLVVGSWTAARLPAFSLFHLSEATTIVDSTAWVARTLGAVVLIALLWIGLPWTIARARGEVILCSSWPCLNLVGRRTKVFWAAATRLDQLSHRFLGVTEPSRDAAIQLRAELLAVVDESKRHGVILSDASQMIHRLLDLHGEDIDSVKIPRTDMVTLPADTSLSDAIRRINESGFSRIPVTRNSIDDVIGVLYARDLLKCIARGADMENESVESVCRTALYVPETQGINQLMDEMRQKKMHMAIVVDEYSGVSGLVTMEDILEEIVGHIADEFDPDEVPTIREQQDGMIEVDGRASIDELNEMFDCHLPDDSDFETISGFLMAEFGRIPRSGETCHWNNLRLTVQQANDRSIERVRLETVEESLKV